MGQLKSVGLGKNKGHHLSEERLSGVESSALDVICSFYCDSREGACVFVDESKLEVARGEQLIRQTLDFHGLHL